MTMPEPITVVKLTDHFNCLLPLGFSSASRESIFTLSSLTQISFSAMLILFFFLLLLMQMQVVLCHCIFYIFTIFISDFLCLNFSKFFKITILSLVSCATEFILRAQRRHSSQRSFYFSIFFKSLLFFSM